MDWQRHNSLDHINNYKIQIWNQMLHNCHVTYAPWQVLAMTCPTVKIKKAHELLLQLLIWTTKNVLGMNTIKRKIKKYHGVGKVFKPNRKT